MNVKSNTQTTAEGGDASEVSLKLLQAERDDDVLNKSATNNTQARLKKPKNARNSCYVLNTFLLFGMALVFLMSGILLLKWPLVNVAMDLQRRMLPQLPSFTLWQQAKPIVYCRVYVFTVTNAEAFLNGTDQKMKIQEVGPIIYRERMINRDVEWHENSTLSYTSQKYLEFLPDENEPGILNKTIIVPNLVLLTMAEKVSNYLFNVKMAFNVISRSDEIFVNITIQNYFWNFSTPALETLDKYLPLLVPLRNGGTLYSIYRDFDDRVNVRIGPGYQPDEFFSINTFDYRPTVPGFRPERGECFADLMNSTEGAIYPNNLSYDTVLYYWRKTVCRPVPLYFEREVYVGWLKGYKYITHTDMYDRTENLTTDCYKGSAREPLPNGLSDVSRCFRDLPLAISAPHFYGRRGYWTDKVEGYTPNCEAHGSYTIVEPLTGAPLDQQARSQSNLILPKLTGFRGEINRFSKMVIPMNWIEYDMPKLTTELTVNLIFISRILPVLQWLLPIVFIITALVIFVLILRRLDDDSSLNNYLTFNLVSLWNKIRRLARRSKIN